MKKIRLVATDLDGTLLNPDKEIDQRIADKIRQLCEAEKLIFTFITGRPIYAIERFSRQMGISAPIVACNGALIYQNDRILARRGLTLSSLRELMYQADAAGCTVLYYADGTEYAMRDTEWVRIREARGRNYPIQDPFAAGSLVPQAEKINIMAQEEPDGFASLRPQLQRLQNDFGIVCYGDQGCEIVAKGVNKASGLRELARLMDLSLENMMAVGDNENDREMLVEAGCGAAVANATQGARSAADYVCAHSYTEGVLEAVRRAAAGGCL